MVIARAMGRKSSRWVRVITRMPIANRWKWLCSASEATGRGGWPNSASARDLATLIASLYCCS